MILWPTQIRRACLCARLMVHEYKKHRRHKVFQSTVVLPGTFFHDSVAGPLFEAMASGTDHDIVGILDRGVATQSDLHKLLWAHLDKKYLSPALHSKSRPKSLSGDHVLFLAEGLGRLSEFLAEIILRQRPDFGSSAELLKSLFLPPEKRINKRLNTESGVSFEVRGKYDALLFDSKDREFIVLEFKCKNDHELIGDLEQVSTYAWMIRESSGIPARAAIFYLGEAPQVKEFPSQILATGFQVSLKLINEIGKWLHAPDPSKIGIPPTTVEGLCEICPLSKSCERLFGPRNLELRRQLRTSLGRFSDTAGTTEGILVGRNLGADESPVYWNPFGGDTPLANGHMLIVGTSGLGKTQVLKSLIAEIVEKDLIPLIFDFNNDYVAPEFLQRHGIKAYYPGDGLPLNPLELVPDSLTGKIQRANGGFSTAGILKRIYGLGVQQEANLRIAMVECYRGGSCKSVFLFGLDSR